jgi:hypothetical protein
MEIIIIPLTEIEVSLTLDPEFLLYRAKFATKKQQQYLLKMSVIHRKQPLTQLFRNALITACGLAVSAVSALASTSCVLPTPAQQPFTPPIRIQMPDGTNGIEANATGSPASFVKVTLANVPGGYSVTNGTYTAWCAEGAVPLCPREVPECLTSVYKPILFNSCDSVSLAAAGIPTGNWDKVNYIINNKAMWAMAGYNVSEIQAAIWRFVGFDAFEEASILSGAYGFGFPAGTVGNVNAIAMAATANGTGFVPTGGQVLAVVLQLPAALQDEVNPPYTGQPGQLVFIEVVCPSGPGTGTPGYWKNHPNAWPVQVIRIGGINYTKAQAISIIKMGDGDKSLTLFRALVCAKLNVLIGNDSSCIASTIVDADLWMSMYPPKSRVKAGGATSPWRTGEPLYLKLDAYNNGLLCAPHRD